MGAHVHVPEFVRYVYRDWSTEEYANACTERDIPGSTEPIVRVRMYLYICVADDWCECTDVQVLRTKYIGMFGTRGGRRKPLHPNAERDRITYSRRCELSGDGQNSPK